MRKWAEIPSELRSITTSSHISQNAFGNVLKQSRFASLPRPIRSEGQNMGKTRPGQPSTSRKSVMKQQKNLHPTHQVITTTPASNFRHDWGLKRPLPTTRSSRFITLDSIDTETGLTDFNSGARYAMILNRIKELQQPVQPILSKHTLDKNTKNMGGSFFQSLQIEKSARSDQTSPSEIHTKSFRAFLKNQGYTPELINNLVQDKPRLEADVKKILSSQVRTSQNSLSTTPVRPNNESSKQTDSLRQPLATAGLLYALPGTLNNRPTSIKTPSTPLFKHSVGLSVPRQDGVIVPGRLVNSNGTLANVGGITGSANLVNVDLVEVQNRQLVYDKVQPFTVQSLGITRQGSVDLVVRAISERQTVHGARNGKVERQKKGALLSSRKKKNSEDELFGLIDQSI